MKHIQLFSLLIMCVLTRNAIAEANDASMQTLRDWGGADITYCLSNNAGNAVIGKNKSYCSGNFSIDASKPSQCVLGDDMGRMLLLARGINENGARFCVTTVYAEHKKKGRAWTLYSDPAEGQKCFWLCKAGHYGEECASETPNGCDSTTVRRSDFDNYTMSRNTNVEDSISRFHWNAYNGCGVHAGQEHDMILAISNWLDSGHGAFARPFMVRARREGWKSNKGGIDIWPVGQETLVCKNGYTANAAGTDCEPVDETACQLTNTCSGWPSGGFDRETMEMHYIESSNCYQYRCKDATQAFASSTSRTCTACSTTKQGAPSPADGVCIMCETGKIFDETAATSGYCVETDVYSKTDMQYGKNHTRNTQPDVDNQCWSMKETTDYINCVRYNELPSES